MSNVRSVVDWLQDGARSAPLAEDVLAQLCARLLERGTPLWRVAVFVRTLHPDIMGRAFFWQPGAAVRAQTATYEFMETAEFRDSPVAAVYKTAQAIRRHLDDPSCPDDFPMLRDLRGQGATDYVAFPLFFTNGSIHVATWTTKQKGGFTAQEFSDLESVIAPLARVAEVRAWVRTAENLLSTYIGNQAGERIMAGNIRRGDVEAISAAIWLSDMRGFTTLSERLPPKELIALLNRYFDAQVPAILEGGGEVLKFMGDGLLAIFPIAGDGDAAAVCRRALACALAARDRIAELPRTENAEGTRLRPRAPYWRGDVRQYRRRQPARFHLHRAGGESRGAAGEGRGETRRDNRRVRGLCPPRPGRTGAPRRIPGRRLCCIANRLRLPAIIGPPLQRFFCSA